MNGAMLLQHAVGVIEHRETRLRAAGGELRGTSPRGGRWCSGSSHPGAGGAVPDRSEAGAAHAAIRRISTRIVDVAGYAACLREVTRA